MGRGRLLAHLVKVFLDTNVLVSAFASRGLCADLMRYLLAEHELLAGEAVLTELRRALTESIGCRPRRSPRSSISFGGSR
jgi:predicted nucleic acid-binding protein